LGVGWANTERGQALGAVWGFESRLHLEVMTQEPQNRSDQIFFRLRLIVARRVGIEDAWDLLYHRMRLLDQVFPLWTYSGSVTFR
jgi:hypothetical protein